MKDWQAYAVLVAFVALCIVAIVLGVRDCDAKNECIDRGGIIHEYDCHWSKSGTHCNWQCVEGR